MDVGREEFEIGVCKGWYYELGVNGKVMVNIGDKKSKRKHVAHLKLRVVKTRSTILYSNLS